MSKLARAIGAIVAGGVIGTLGWQVGFAAPPTNDTLVVCQRPGADLRSPATNGTCPSGYTLVEITETAPNPVAGYHDDGVATGQQLLANNKVVTLALPPGSYALQASGTMENNVGRAQCMLVYAGQQKPLDLAYLERATGEASDPHTTLTGVVDVSGGLAVWVQCSVTGTNAGSSVHTWQLTAIRLDTLIRQ